MGKDIDIKYNVVRSDRKSVSIQIKQDGTVLVRAPRRISDARIRAFLEEKKGWIIKHLNRMEQIKEEEQKMGKLSQEDIQKLADMALKVIPERVKYYAPLVGVTYGRITIRNQKTRWGSCSSNGNLNFNCLLMLTPSEVIDSVVVHELCHRKEMNHSARFYAEVNRVFPEYERWDRWLKEHGPALIRRMM